MTYKNNAYWNLLGSIWASTTTMTIKDSRGWLFPSTYPFYLTIEQLDTSNVVTKREIVSVTNRVSDTFTITRSAWTCPASDTATTQTTTAYSFTDWALVQLRVLSEDLNWLSLKTNVLELDNTSVFTPDTDYEPATKKYVDDSLWTIKVTVWEDITAWDTICYYDEYERISSNFASPWANSRWLTFDWTNLISSDAGTDLIYIHSW